MLQPRRVGQGGRENDWRPDPWYAFHHRQKIDWKVIIKQDTVFQSVKSKKGDKGREKGGEKES